MLYWTRATISEAMSAGQARFDLRLVCLLCGLSAATFRLVLKVVHAGFDGIHLGGIVDRFEDVDVY